MQTRPSLVHPYLQQPHCGAIKKGSLWNKLAWWPLPASSIPMPPLSPTTNHHKTPLLFTLSHISRDIISFYTWDYSHKGQSQQVFYKKCILMFRATHGHLASITGVWVFFCKIAIVCFLSIRYRSDGLYYKMAGIPSSPTRFSIRVDIDR